MNYFLLLSKENLNLSIAEAEAVINKKCKTIDNLLFTTTKRDLKRLAYTKSIFKHLFTTTEKQLNKTVSNYNWKRHYKKSFAVRTHNLNQDKDIASKIWHTLEKPNVNLKNPATEFHFFKKQNKIIAGILQYELDPKQFEQRKAHKRPELHPSSLHPRLARAMINLTGINKGKILDPFCGSGGILIEAGLLNLYPVGSDIINIQIKRAILNLSHAKIKAFTISNTNAFNIHQKFNYIVTDLPYGKSTKTSKDLFKQLELHLPTILNKTAVIALPSNIKFKPKLKLKHEFKIYLHKSLTKKILVFSI